LDRDRHREIANKQVLAAEDAKKFTSLLDSGVAKIGTSGSNLA